MMMETTVLLYKAKSNKEKETMDSQLQSERIRELMSRGLFAGSYAPDGVSTDYRFLALDKASHIILSTFWEDLYLYGKINILEDTFFGKELAKEIIKNNGMIKFAPRAMIEGGTHKIARLITFDWVVLETKEDK